MAVSLLAALSAFGQRAQPGAASSLDFLPPSRKCWKKPARP